MGVDIGVKRQTPELKEAYENLYKTFNDRQAFFEEHHPLFPIYYIIEQIIEAHPFIDDIDIAGIRWSNLSIHTAAYIPYSNNVHILDFTIKEQVLFTEEISKLVTQFDKIYLKLYPDDQYIKRFSHTLHYLVDNNLMLIPC